jgi:hypothetical protein
MGKGREMDRETDREMDMDTVRQGQGQGHGHGHGHGQFKCGKNILKMDQLRKCTQEKNHSMLKKHAANHDSLFLKIQQIPPDFSVFIIHVTAVDMCL